MVPLKDENRTLSKIGLEKLACTKRPGLRALKQVAGLNGSLGSYEIGFQLAPRLNAAGRLETALDALELLLTSDAERAAALAAALDQQNRERQAVEQEIVDQILSALRSRFDPAKHFAIVEAQPAWHLGVVGIVASRVLREFHRPVFILGGDGPENFRGSGRSIDGFNLAAALRDCGDLLIRHGGHAMAAGITLLSNKLPEFRERLSAAVQRSVSADLLQPALQLDAEVRLADLNFETLKGLLRIEPAGQGNPPVQLAARNLQPRGGCRRIGKDQQHVKFAASDGTATHQILWWNCPAEPPPRFDLAFTPELSEYNGTYGIQLKVLDLKPLA
jgi:single-stranded-DNA-specific exonuclease